MWSHVRVVSAHQSVKPAMNRATLDRPVTGRRAARGAIPAPSEMLTTSADSTASRRSRSPSCAAATNASSSSRCLAGLTGSLRSVRTAFLDLVELPDLRVPVAIRAVGKLERDEGLAGGAEVAGSGLQQFVDELFAGQTREQLVDDQPLVMPAQRAPRLVEGHDHGENTGSHQSSASGPASSSIKGAP